MNEVRNACKDECMLFAKRMPRTVCLDMVSDRTIAVAAPQSSQIACYDKLRRWKIDCSRAKRENVVISRYSFGIKVRCFKKLSIFDETGRWVCDGSESCGVYLLFYPFMNLVVASIAALYST